MIKLDKKHFVILGGGMTGLSLGWLLRSLGAHVQILEKEKTCGGIGRTHELNGLPYEFGPHILHAKKEATINFYKKYGVIHRDYYTKMVLNDDPKRLIDFPYSADILKQLPPDISSQVEKEIAQLNPEAVDQSNLETYLSSIFGKTLYDVFNRGYSRKFWGKDPKLIPSNGAAGWINFRTDDRRVFMEWQGYPKNGYNKFFEWMGQGIDIVKASVEGLEITGSSVSAVKTDKGRMEADCFISTLSPEVIFKDVPSPDYIGKVIVFIHADKGPVLPVGVGGIYFPGQGQFNRVVEYPSMNCDEYPNLNKGTVLGVEYPSFTGVTQKDLDGYVQDAVAAVKQLWGCVVQGTSVHYESKVYPLRNRVQVDLFNKINEEKVNPLSNLHMTGRLGNFVYVNMNDCFEMAVRTIGGIAQAEKFEIERTVGIL